MREDGVRNALAFVTSAYSSYSSCRQYRENIAAARNEVGEDAPQVEKLRSFYNHPLFMEANRDNIQTALDRIPADRRSTTELIFTAHSIPETMAMNCAYEKQLQELSQLIAQELNHQEYRLVFQSRSGPPTQPWLGPDICDYLKTAKTRGIDHVVIAPIGFVSDHMEIIYDLDTEARQLCEQIGINMVRVPTAGTHPLFPKMVRELIMERISSSSVRPFVGTRGPLPDVCADDCCPAFIQSQKHASY
jgi:ferrochelatase